MRIILKYTWVLGCHSKFHGKFIYLKIIISFNNKAAMKLIHMMKRIKMKLIIETINDT